MEKTAIKTPETEHLYYIEVEIDKIHKCGKLPEGKYLTIPITGGRFEGKKLKGTVLPMGADWNILRPGVFSHVTTRYVLQTDDGEIISLFTDGHAHFGPASIPGMITKKPDPAKIYFRQHLFFQTGSPKYSWLNDRVCFAVVCQNPERKVCYDAYMIK